MRFFPLSHLDRFSNLILWKGGGGRWNGCPTTNVKFSWNTGIYALHTRFFAHFYAQSVIISKISALELGRKFIESALLVGWRRGENLGSRKNLKFKLSSRYSILPNILLLELLSRATLLKMRKERGGKAKKRLLFLSSTTEGLPPPLHSPQKNFLTKLGG